MHCPRGDNELVDQKPRLTDGLVQHYLVCPSCRGHWLSAFDANYISSLDLSDNALAGWNPVGNLTCPQCRKILVRTVEESVPPEVIVYQCPDHHGYFFPAGELLKFKDAQEIKITYHKRWHVPLASVTSAMLMTLFGLLVSVGLVTGTLEGHRQESTRIKAEGIISTQRYYVDQFIKSVTIITLTTEKTTVTVIVDGQEYDMLAPDGHSHVFRLTNIAPGNHRYIFRFQNNGNTLLSPEYTFVMP